MTLIDQIRDMIAEGETEKSLDELYSYVKENNADIIDQLVMLRNRNRNLQRSVQMGTMDAQDASLERAKINEAILKLLPQLTPEYLAQASRRLEVPTAAAAAAAAPSARRAANTEAEPAARKNFMPYLIGGGAVLLLLVLVGLFSGGGGEEPAPAATVMEAQPAAEEAAPAASGSPSASAPSHDQQEPTTSQTTPAHSTSADELIRQVMAAHGGYVAWQSQDGRSTFVVNPEDGTCEEVGADGSVCCHFQVTGSDGTYLNLYDASRAMNLRVNDSQMFLRHNRDNEWRVLYRGGWVNLGE
jgi:hypothetical protein